ncbi:TRAP transporter large permease [Hespellia stercorisuis]|uniref:TRAP transporter, DctM subunit n=1 Tax=Hespellia stercorisuis DSM 15480 TaxID=1121950 RepID=A0A1M6KB26_9FIRM|nr:TRAP transporter large permease [Hespellia stercorisuis]SHJ56161.1 TRAP transporter, DctM subunit [Hespellia stercorisuis DSM 15480]
MNIDWQILFILMLIILFALLFAGEWIAFTLMLVGTIGILIIGKSYVLNSIGQMAWNTVCSFDMTAIPLFILMGELMVHGGLSKGFYRSAAMWLRRLPGGLLQTNIVSCAIFAAISGSSPATAAAIGSVSYPELEEKGYDRQMIVGSLAGGGALGVLIPPSINMLIYASIAECSVTKLFVAGIVPGGLCALCFMCYIGIRSVLHPELAPRETERYTFKEKIKESGGLFSFIFLIFIVLGSIYTGWATTTEAAALGAFVAFLMTVVTRNLTLDALKESLLASVRLSSMILAIIFGAKVLSYFIALSGISKGVTNWIVSLNPSIVLLFACIIVMYLVLGCILEGTSMIYLTIPVLLPILVALNIDLIWFGVILTLLTEIGMITPPVGINLYVIHSIADKNCSFSDVIKGALPYCAMYLFVTIAIIAIPALALWLPGTM